MNQQTQVHIGHQAPLGFWQTALTALKQFGFLGTTARFLLLKDEIRKFIRSAPCPEEQRFRKQLIRRFDRIQFKIQCGHTPYDLLLMADHILNLEAEGPIIECGCFKGASTAKLSILAQHTNRKLIVCDSFEGLPAPESYERKYSIDGSEDAYSFSAGEYRGTLEEVKKNVETYGSIEVCEFVKGYFEDTLPGLQVHPAFIFMDVDLISSARTCLKYLWPRFRSGGVWYTHEACYREYMEAVFDRNWWQQELRDLPPMVVGAIRGLSPLSRALAYFQKSPAPGESAHPNHPLQSGRESS